MNKKGFTLIELLAVIVILSFLMILAIPNVTSRIMESRKRAFLTDARTIASVTKSSYTSSNYVVKNLNVIEVDNKVMYPKESIDKLLNSKLNKSSFNTNYKDASVYVSKKELSSGGNKYDYFVCLIDGNGNGFDFTRLDRLNADSIEMNGNLKGCSETPKAKYKVNVSVQNGTVDVGSKTVVEGENVSFNLTPASEEMHGVVMCDVNNTASINESNVLSINKIDDDTTCNVTFSTATTVLYADGTLIINERLSDRDTNIGRYGSVLKEYPSLSNANRYVFSSENEQLWYSQRSQIKNVLLGMRVKPTSMAYWFYGLSNMSYGNFSNLDTSDLSNLYMTFYQAGYSASTFKLIGLNNWNTSKVTSMKYMFEASGYNSTSWDIGDLSNWDTSNVQSMSWMFENAGQLSTSWSVGDLSNWNTSKVLYMEWMFSRAGYSASVFNIGNISNWDTSKVKQMQYMFAATGHSATTWNAGNFSNWDTSNVTLMTAMFAGAGYSANSFNLNLSNWNIVNATSLSSMFSDAGYNAANWSIGDLSRWNTSNVTSFYDMFTNAGYNATIWNIGNLNNWDTSNVTTMRTMFYGAGYNATTWNVGNLSNWNTSKVTEMTAMFANAGYNATTWSIGSLSNWDVSNVTSMSSMFKGAGRTASMWNIGNLNNWNTSKVESMSSMFAVSGDLNATTWNIGNISNWDVSNVTNMSSMFNNSGRYATTWSVGDLSSWNMSKVTDASNMFNAAGQFSNTWNSIGTLNIYANNIFRLFYGSHNAKAVLNIHNNPSDYTGAFYSAAIGDSASIKVNYSSSVTSIDSIIATKSSNSQVIKGQLL